MDVQTWRLICHHSNPEGALDAYWRDEFIALGWRIDDLRDLLPRGPHEIKSWFDAHSERLIADNASEGARCMWGFYHEMVGGDLVILGTGKRRVRVVRVRERQVGDYTFARETHPVIGDYWHRRAVERKGFNPDELWKLSGGCAPGWNPRWALILCKNRVRCDG